MNIQTKLETLEKQYKATKPIHTETYHLWEGTDGKEYIKEYSFDNKHERYEMGKVAWTNPPRPENTHRIVFHIRRYKPKNLKKPEIV